MKIKTLLIILISSSLSGDLLAQERRPGARPELRQQILEKFDKNNDGQLDEAERKAARSFVMKQRAGAGDQKPLRRPDAQQRPSRRPDVDAETLRKKREWMKNAQQKKEAWNKKQSSARRGNDSQRKPGAKGAPGRSRVEFGKNRRANQQPSSPRTRPEKQSGGCPNCGHHDKGKQELKDKAKKAPKKQPKAKKDKQQRKNR